MKKQRPKNILLIICVFALCAYGFWLNAQNQFSSIMREEVNRIDETDTLSDEDIRYLKGYKREFAKAFEIELIIRIVDDIGTISQPQLPAYICIAIAPGAGESSIATSTLVKALLGQDTINTYNQQYLQPYIADGNWQTGLKHFLDALTKELATRMNHNASHTEENSANTDDNVANTEESPVNTKDNVAKTEDSPSRKEDSIFRTGDSVGNTGDSVINKDDNAVNKTDKPSRMEEKVTKP